MWITEAKQAKELSGYKYIQGAYGDWHNCDHIISLLIRNHGADGWCIDAVMAYRADSSTIIEVYDTEAEAHSAMADIMDFMDLFGGRRESETFKATMAARGMG